MSATRINHINGLYTELQSFYVAAKAEYEKNDIHTVTLTDQLSSEIKELLQDTARPKYNSYHLRHFLLALHYLKFKLSDLDSMDAQSIIFACITRLWNEIKIEQEEFPAILRILVRLGVSKKSIEANLPLAKTVFRVIRHFIGRYDDRQLCEMLWSLAHLTYSLADLKRENLLDPIMEAIQRNKNGIIKNEHALFQLDAARVWFGLEIKSWSEFDSILKKIHKPKSSEIHKQISALLTTITPEKFENEFLFAGHPDLAIDIYFPCSHLVIELDGEAHKGKTHFGSDSHKCSLLRILSWPAYKKPVNILRIDVSKSNKYWRETDFWQKVLHQVGIPQKKISLRRSATKFTDEEINTAITQFVTFEMASEEDLRLAKDLNAKPLPVVETGVNPARCWNVPKPAPSTVSSTRAISDKEFPVLGPVKSLCQSEQQVVKSEPASRPIVNSTPLPWGNVPPANTKKSSLLSEVEFPALGSASVSLPTLNSNPLPWSKVPQSNTAKSSVVSDIEFPALGSPKLSNKNASNKTKLNSQKEIIATEPAVAMSSVYPQPDSQQSQEKETAKPECAWALRFFVATVAAVAVTSAITISNNKMP